MFEKVKEKYKERDHRLLRSFKFLSDTELGLWAPSSMDVCRYTFEKIELKKYRNFVDLGSGDGRISLIASLYTQSYGIECDEKLNKIAKQCAGELNLKCEFIQDDFMKVNIEDYDVVFINPDTPFYRGIEEKMLRELKGRLLVYDKIFLPRKLKKRREFVLGGISVTEFSKG